MGKERARLCSISYCGSGAGRGTEEAPDRRVKMHGAEIDEHKDRIRGVLRDVRYGLADGRTSSLYFPPGGIVELTVSEIVLTSHLSENIRTLAGKLSLPFDLNNVVWCGKKGERKD